MKRNATSEVLRGLFRLLAAAAFAIVAIAFFAPDTAQAAGDSVIKKSLKAGQKDSSVKLTKEKNTVIYEIDVPKNDAELGLLISIGNVSDRLIIKC